MSKRVKGPTTFISIVIALTLLGGAVLADGSIHLVTEETIGHNWFVTYEVGDGRYVLVKGPGDPPLGDGSLALSARQLSDDVIRLATREFRDQPISALEGLSYHTYRGAASTAPADILPSAYVTILYSTYVNEMRSIRSAELVWEPRHAYGGDAVGAERWQRWDTSVGEGWRSSVAFGDVCALDCIVSWATLQSVLPTDAIIGWMGVTLGPGPAGSFAGAVDAYAVTLNGTTTTYNFETVREETTVSQPAVSEVFLYAGQHQMAGTLSLGVDGANLVVRYDLSDDDALASDWVFTGLHLAVAPELAGIPQTGGRVNNPIPGRFPHKVAFDPEAGVTQHTFTIPLADTVGELVIAAHADILNRETGEEEGAWAAGEARHRFTARGNWATYVFYSLD